MDVYFDVYFVNNMKSFGLGLRLLQYFFKNGVKYGSIPTSMGLNVDIG